MAISDTKKVQTLVNVTAEQIITVRSAVSTMKSMRDLYQAANPSVAGTCISGSVASINSAINALDSIINSGSNSDVWDGLVNCYVPTHHKEAL